MLPHGVSCLSQFAKGGRDAFYKGDIAEAIASFIKDQGGFLTTKDLSEHRSEWIEPVSTNYRGYDIWELPPNGQGIAALEMLNVIEGFDVKKMGHNSADLIHLFVEAKKLAFADRDEHYGDPQFVDVPLDALLSDRCTRSRRLLPRAC